MSSFRESVGVAASTPAGTALAAAPITPFGWHEQSGGVPVQTPEIATAPPAFVTAEQAVAPAPAAPVATPPIAVEPLVGDGERPRATPPHAQGARPSPISASSPTATARPVPRTSTRYQTHVVSRTAGREFAAYPRFHDGRWQGSRDGKLTSTTFTGVTVTIINSGIARTTVCACRCRAGATGAGADFPPSVYRHAEGVDATRLWRHRRRCCACPRTALLASTAFTTRRLRCCVCRAGALVQANWHRLALRLSAAAVRADRYQ